MSVAVRQHAQSLIKDFTADSAAVPQPADAAEAVIARCLVFCRVRPSTARDYEDGAFQLVSVEKKRVIIKDERHYDFDGTFDQDARQEDIFTTVAVPCINHALKGFCSALMCYGQTGTGKSFTMCCTKPGIEGVIPRSARYLFERAKCDTNRTYTVQGQFIQIYRDQLGDLMSDSGRDKVDIRFEASEGVTLTGCSTHNLANETEFMNFYNEGNQRRVVTATAMNPESSRGHTAMVVWIASEPVDDPCGAKYRGKITFIDLAGYERFSKTGISNANPVMKDEAKTINASLLSLGHVVTSLSNGDKHIPWRNAKLTRLLQDSIGGRSRTSIILTIGPSSDHLHETANSLQFGLRAMAVKVEAKMSVTVDYEKLAAKLQLMLDEKNERISLLELQIASKDAERAELLERHQRDDQNLQVRLEAELQQLIKDGATEEQIKTFHELRRVELENLKEQQQEEIIYQEEIHNKEIVNLVTEQQKQENRKQVEMRLVQERIIEEFQSKLESAREGTNEDLVKAIQELSQKDAILASRANDIARFHEHIQTLQQQIRDLGEVPAAEARTLPETFLDISQFEQLQSKLEGELERQHLKVVDLRAQLEKITLVCNERLDEITQYREENDKLRGELRNAGLTVEETTQQLQSLEHQKAKLIDPVELETLRVNMQADIDELKSCNEELETELNKTKEQLKEQQQQLTQLQMEQQQHAQPNSNNNSYINTPLTGRIRGLSVCMTSRGRPPVGQHVDSATAQYREQFSNLQQIIANGEHERNTLCQRIAELENLLAENAIEFDDDEYPEAPRNQDMEALLEAKDKEVEAMMGFLTKLENQLNSERNARAFLESTNQKLSEQVRNCGQTPIVSTDDVASKCNSGPTVPLEVYSDLLRKVRDSTSRICRRLSTRSPFDEDPDVETEFEEILRDRDEELQMKDEMILTKTNECNALVRVADRLEKQLEALGIEPVCRMSADHRSALDNDSREVEAMRQQQQALEDDRRKMQNILETLKADRTVSANDKLKLEIELQEARRQAKELEAQKQEQLAREALLQEQTRLATRQMMDAQARVAAHEGSGGLLAKFKKLLS